MPANSTNSSPNVTWFPPKEQEPKQKWLTTKAPATFDKVELVSASLGILIGIGIPTLFKCPGVGVYMISIGIFHLSEFWITAKFNSKSLGMWSFLLTNGVGYAGAQLISAFEVIFKYFKFGLVPQNKLWFTLGFVITVVGSMVRAAAMIQAGKSFNHYVQKEKQDDHKLVTTGLYSLVRHPSYTGFFFWSVGSQLMLQNWVSLAAFVVILFVFFANRINVEEHNLVKFFGEDYEVYKTKVWSGIPFI